MCRIVPRGGGRVRNPARSLPTSTATPTYASAATWRSAVGEGLRNGLASGGAAACAKAALQPFDSIKTVQQHATTELTLMAAARDLVERAGVGGLYSGLLVAIVGAVPSVFVYFGVYQYWKRTLAARWSTPERGYASGGGLAAVMVAAAIGNLMASFLRPPPPPLALAAAARRRHLHHRHRRRHRPLLLRCWWSYLACWRSATRSRLYRRSA